MKPPGRRGILLAVLAALLVAAGWRAVRRGWEGPGPAAAGVVARLADAASPAGDGAALGVEELDLDRLEAKPATYTPGRDPFRFGPPPKPPGPSPEELEAARREREEAERAAREAKLAAAEPPAPQPPPIDLVYLGSFGRPGRKIAVFSDGETIYNALAGEVLDGKFIVADIGYESVAIRFVGFPDVPPRRLAAGG